MKREEGGNDMDLDNVWREDMKLYEVWRKDMQLYELWRRDMQLYELWRKDMELYFVRWGKLVLCAIFQPCLVIYGGQFPQLEEQIVPGSEPATFR